jgi:hypothetical protein
MWSPPVQNKTIDKDVRSKKIPTIRLIGEGLGFIAIAPKIANANKVAEKII